MSFVPAPQQANAAAANNAPYSVNSSTAAAAAETHTNDQDLVFKIRTFDVYWVEKSALMYKDGFDKVSRFVAIEDPCYFDLGSGAFPGEDQQAT